MGSLTTIICSEALVVELYDGGLAEGRLGRLPTVMRSASPELQKTVMELKSTLARQETTIACQQKQIETLTAGLQKVSAQLAAASPSSGGLEMSKFATGRIRRGEPAPQTALNNQ